MNTISNPEIKKLIDRVTENQEIITLITEDNKKAFLLSQSAFENLLGVKKISQEDREDNFHYRFKQALSESGYDTKEKIIELVREIKKELLAERELL
jgi:hypothetical protein